MESAKRKRKFVSVAADRILLAGAGNGWPQGAGADEDPSAANRSASVILVD
ncbi:MAG: hypothetical protein RIF32_18645 [Leptospirales bacterium]